MTSFDTVLVANRGEIACRVLRSARLLGLSTVAVYSDADRGALHVRDADRAVRIGGSSPRDSYLRIDRVIEAALETGAGAIHPGYGFLSESAALAEAAEDAGVVFVGPTVAQLLLFGQKHTARAAAEEAGVPLLPGSGLLAGPDDAIAAAEMVGWPVMVKATGGGGGIGMQRCADADELRSAFTTVRDVATSNFGSGGVYIERMVDRARHVEVQLFGDGGGRVLTLGDRDCSLQRRNQKVIEEAPAPNLPVAVRRDLERTAHDLAASVRYRSAGTVEYVYDAEREEAYFLEVNTRLQVEHPVTEAVFRVDLVSWMLRLANGDATFFDEPLEARGHAIEARIYAEDPAMGFLPSSGLLTEVAFPDGVRVDSWVEAGTEMSAFYDPLLAKIIADGPDRNTARHRLVEALGKTRIGGIETNLGFDCVALGDRSFIDGRHDTSTLSRIIDPTSRIDVRSPGTMSTVQDWPGRLGFWDVGVPPSGPMDDLSFRLGNRALGNPPGAPGLECALTGPTLAFSAPTEVCVTGAPVSVSVDGADRPMWEPFGIPAGGVLTIGTIEGPGLRSYLLVAGGLDVPLHLGSASTFTLGGFGGHAGRALRTGDVLHPNPRARGGDDGETGPIGNPPSFTSEWSVGVLEGPHGAPEFFTPGDVDVLFATGWQVHFNSARTGVRLVGPAPEWARSDGGDAGLHPSNIHDTPYATATIDFTGDTPILLGPDGPSLGGFVCPATVAISERWKLGQLRPGDTVHFVPITAETATRRRAVVGRSIGRRRHPGAELGTLEPLATGRDPEGGILRSLPETDARPTVTFRRAGEDHLLVEYGPMILDLGLRMRVHSLAEAIRTESPEGILDLTPGIRSLQIHIDPDRVTLDHLLDLATALEEMLPPTADLDVSSRIVHLPLSWDDPATREAIERYMAGVRDDAPWCPWNIEFIRRVNGLGTVDDVKRIVFDAQYLVLGLGDVYLGAPVATPVDPRHRLVTTKYNPARTWTPENAVGIGGAYLCIYGMEGPGGYQFVGRTIPVWSRWHGRPPFAPGQPSLLRHFDRICWYPVTADELLDLRADMRAGRLDVRTEGGRFVLADHEAFLSREQASIAAFKSRQSTAFDAERERWRASGEFDRVAASENGIAGSPGDALDLAPGAVVITAPLAASVWRVDAAPGTSVEAGDLLFTLEAMKLEITVVAPTAGVVDRVLVRPGEQIATDHPLAVLTAAPEGV